jgi:hypothetical protein
MKNSNDKKRYILNIPFGTNLDFLVIDEIVVRVILPEGIFPRLLSLKYVPHITLGSTNIKWEAPFIDIVEERGHRRTYLDTIGRPMLELRKKK